MTLVLEKPLPRLHNKNKNHERVPLHGSECDACGQRGIPIRASGGGK